MSKKNGWVGVDLDGTLAHYEGWNGGKIGRPVEAMVERVRTWLKLGLDVRVFTARVAEPDEDERAEVVGAIEEWCEEHVGQKLKVTNVKDFSCIEIWDDRAVGVEENTGRAFGPSRVEAEIRAAVEAALTPAS